MPNAKIFLGYSQKISQGLSMFLSSSRVNFKQPILCWTCSSLFKTIHHGKGSLHSLPAAYTRQELWFFSSDTVVAESGFVANTRMGRSHTIVSTSNMAGACHMASAVGLGDSSRVGNGALVVTNSKWRRHFKLTVNGIKIYTCIYSFHLKHSQSWHKYNN